MHSGFVIFIKMIDNEKDKQGVVEEHKIDSFVDSIEEEIRNENWQRLWNKYGKFITYASSFLLIGVAVYSMWQRQDLADREAISSKYTVVQSAIMAGDNATALTQIRELSNVSKKDYATLSKFEYAAILREKHQPDALDEYKAIFEDRKVNAVLRDLAYIFYVNSAIDLMTPKNIGENIDKFIEEIKTKHIGKYWDLFAKETLAFCYIKKGDTKAAKEALESLAKTTGISETMAERAKMLLHSIGE